MPYVAKSTFMSPYGNFVEGKPIDSKHGQIKRIPKQIILDWEKNGLLEWKPDTGEEGDDYEISPPTQLELNAMSEDELEAATRPGSTRSGDLGTLSGKK